MRVERILVIDDDELSREVMALLLVSDGYAVESAESGDAALRMTTFAPDVIVTDMQMPGLTGDPLAVQLRAVFGPTTRVVAMSGTEVPAGQRMHFDGFLLKPFSVADLHALLADEAPTARETTVAVLDETIYAKLSRSMSAKQVAEMFAFCLADAGTRLERMKQAVASGDEALYCREAHTIKGGCGMLGALELREIAGAMETIGIEGERNEVSNLRDRFVLAAERLQRMLEAHTQ